MIRTTKGLTLIPGGPINDERRDGGHRTRVTRQGTLSTYTYAEGVIAVGGYRNSDNEPLYIHRLAPDLPKIHTPLRQWTRLPSSPNGQGKRGPVERRHPKPRVTAAEEKPVSGSLKAESADSVYGPDWAAVSEESPALSGVLAAGTYSGSVAILGGTSVAAPQVTRALADEIAARSLAQKPANLRRSKRQKCSAAADGSGRLSFVSSYPKRR